MAAGLITVSGTGQVLIQYIDAGSVARSLITGPGTLYLDTTGTDFTWTTLSGNATASSGVITLVEIETTCYILSWEEPILGINTFQNPRLKFNGIELDGVTTSINESYFPMSSLRVGTSINDADISNIKATAYKDVISNGSAPESHYLIVQVQGTDVIPYLRIANETSSQHLYIKGVVTGNCLPAGYTAIETCQFGSVLA